MINPNDKKRKLMRVNKSLRTNRSISRDQYYTTDNYLKQVSKKRKTLNVK